jgi:hypothetical protein
MKRIDIVKRGDGWIGESKGRVVSRGATKDDAIHNTARVAKADPEPVTVKIHRLAGKIQEERTYPRRADPSSSKG